jgi:hypothetical protein
MPRERIKWNFAFRQPEAIKSTIVISERKFKHATTAEFVVPAVISAEIDESIVNVKRRCTRLVINM